MKNRIRRFLAGVCTSLMLLQSIGESGFVMFAAAADEAQSVVEEQIEAAAEAGSEAVTEETGEESAPEVGAEDDTAAAEEADAEDTVSDDEVEDAVYEDETVEAEDTASDNEAEVVVDDSVSENEAVSDNTVNEPEMVGTTLPSGAVIGDDGSVTYGGQTYGEFKNGTLTINESVSMIPPIFANWLDLTAVEFKMGAIASVIQSDTKGNGAFKGCTNLKKLDLSNAKEMTTIEKNAFNGCINLDSISFNSTLQYIFPNAFSGCAAVTSIVLPEGLINLGAGAFSNCSKLEKITIDTTNLSLTSGGIFSGCNIKGFEFGPKANNKIIPAYLFDGAGFSQDVIIKIPVSVNEIGKNAFSGSTIVNVDLPDNLTTISESAFKGCNKLASIEFTDNVKTIGKSAFSSCTGLSELVLPDKVESIGDSAFSGCTNISTLTLGEGTKIEENSLGSGIFSGCSALTSVTITHKYVGEKEFASCKSLAEVVFSVHDTEIGDRAFQGCELLADVVFSDNVTKIGAGAFQNCVALKEILIPKNVTVIPNSCFKSCVSLNSVMIPDNSDGITTIGASAFESCSSLYSIYLPTSLETIGDSAFKGCISFGNQKIQDPDDPDLLLNLIIPENVTTIGASAFQGCSSIDVVRFEFDPEKVTCGAKIFYLDYLRKIVFPKNISKIPANLFNQATWVTDREIEIPNTVKTIGKGAFTGNSSDPLSSNFWKITFEPVKNTDGNPIDKNEKVVSDNDIDKYCYTIDTIEDNAFSNSRALEGFFLPDSLTTIGASAFSGCIKLEQIEIPESVNHIGASAFSGCSELTTVSFNAVEAKECGKSIFSKCNILYVVFGDKVELIPDYLFYGAQFAVSKTDGKYEHITIEIPAATKRIGDYALPNIVNPVEVLFNEGANLTVIGKNAFQQCEDLNLDKFPEGLTEIGDKAFYACIKINSEIDLPENLTKIGAGAFEGCVSINSVTGGVSLNEISDSIFKNCSNLQTIDFDTMTAVNKIGVSAFEGCVSLNQAVIPVSVNSIGNKAFYRCAKLVNVQLNTGLQTLGTSAFEGCTELKEIKIPVGVTKIGDKAFSGCWGLTDVQLNEGLQTLGTSAFEGCTELKEIKIPVGVTKIGDKAFSGCSALTNVQLNEGLQTIGTSAFEGCTALEEIMIPVGVTKIGDKAFSGCSVLTDVQLNEGLQTIGASAFENCIAIEEIRIPDGVKTIGAKAFLGCSSLKLIYIPASVTSIGSQAFDIEFKAQMIFHVVAGSKAEKWLKDNGFLTVALLKITYVLSENKNNPNKPDNGGNPTIYEAGDTTILLPGNWAGYRFVGWYLDQACSADKKIESLSGQNTDITLYAKWEAETYNITYELRGGNNDAQNPDTYTTESDVVLKPATKAGYRFVGWYTDLNDNSTKVETLKWKCDNLILLAKWDGGKVAAPVASIPGGSVREGTIIRLSCATDGVTILYTIDGSDPAYDTAKYDSESSMPDGTTEVYEDSIVIDGEVEILTIKAMAVRDDSVDSDIVTFTYNVINEANYWGDIAETDRAGFADATEVPAGIWVAGIGDAIYTGEAVTFNIRVYDYKTRLSMGTDYSVSYANNRLAAKLGDKKVPTVTITGKGNYSTTKIVRYFNINPCDIGGDAFSADDIVMIANNKVLTPAPALYWNGKKLANKKDYTVSCAQTIVAAGEYDVVLKGAGNFTGTRTVKCIVGSGTKINKVKVTGLVKSFIYDGTAKEQNLTVTYAGVVLTKDVDYEIIYPADITSAGTVKFKLRGKGNFCGEKQFSYTIKQVARLTAAMVKATAVPGSDGMPGGVSIVVKNGATTLVEGKDYEYVKPVAYKPGTTKITVNGKGGYTGTVKVKLAGMDISNASFAFLSKDGSVNALKTYGIAVGGVKPEVSLTLAGVKLAKNADYTIAYTANKAVGQATVTITGKGNYSGSIRQSFTITRQDLSKLFGYANDVVYKAKSNIIFNTKLSIYDNNGKVLGKTCYDLKFTYADGREVAKTDVIRDNTVITVTATGKGNYTGTFTTTFKVGSRSIASATFKVADQYYSGSAVEPSKRDITITGKLLLTENDYEIVGYITNVSKGSGKVIIRGKGQYSGVKLVNFKILQKPFTETVR